MLFVWLFILLSVHPSDCNWNITIKLSLNLPLFSPNITGTFLSWFFFKFLKIKWFHSKTLIAMATIQKNFENLPLRDHLPDFKIILQMTLYEIPSSHMDPLKTWPSKGRACFQDMTTWKTFKIFSSGTTGQISKLFYKNVS